MPSIWKIMTPFWSLFKSIAIRKRRKKAFAFNCFIISHSFLTIRCLHAKVVVENSSKTSWRRPMVQFIWYILPIGDCFRWANDIGRGETFLAGGSTENFTYKRVLLPSSTCCRAEISFVKARLQQQQQTASEWWKKCGIRRALGLNVRRNVRRLSGNVRSDQID